MREIKLRKNESSSKAGIITRITGELFTGAYDNIGSEIWEGDKLKDETELYEVVWVDDWAGFGLKVLESQWPKKIDLVLQDFDMKYVKEILKVKK